MIRMLMYICILKYNLYRLYNSVTIMVLFHNKIDDIFEILLHDDIIHTKSF